MSAALLRKSLEIVDPELSSKQSNKNKKNNKKRSDTFCAVPENQKLLYKVTKKGRKGEKVNLLSRNSNKLTVTELKKNHKTKDQILRDNLRKLEEIRKVCAVELDQNLTKQIIERAVTKRPIKARRKTKKQEKTVFTEDDFKKFEEEYFDD